jgi:peptide/nickel transport system substrate-binding protein
VLANAYSALLYMDSQGKIHDYMAKTWKVNATSATFNLKQGITCSDGTPVTATVVKNSLQRMIDTKNQYNALLWGPGPYSLSADDTTGTVTFTTQSPFPDLQYGFTQAFPASLTGVICPAGLKDPSQLVTKMFGSGAYTLVEAVHGDHVTFKLRPEFNWGPDGTSAKTVGIPETVVVKVMPNETTAANALLTGSVDVIAGSLGSLVGPDVDRLLKDSTLYHLETPTWALKMLVFNESPGKIGTDETIRKALITAADPKAWLQAADAGHGRLSPTFVTTDTACYDPSVAKLAPKPSIEAGRKILTDAGWTFANGKLSKDGQPLKFQFLGGQQFNQGPEYLVTQWTRMGADVSFTNPDFSAYATGILQGNYEVSIVSTSSPGPFMGPVARRVAGPKPPQGTNYARTNDPVLDQEMNAALSSAGAESCKHWSAFQQQLWKKWHLMGLDATYGENFSKNIDLSLGTNSYMVRRFK